ncbi:MAG: carbohydrate ABC transporter permease [Rubrobacteraceae bacterium]|nr:carbohydrate ABC transporter permease [Rubrobacteraceae bacterium]MBA3615109.1 carbohydrate ABC transporter permease [Rubrobacteraceae bacterium]MDQ3437030.1 carbohydrate ABC transporter permease [Actinomycetota bacterium]
MRRESRQQGITSSDAPYGTPWLGSVAKYLVLGFFAALVLYPLLLIISTSLKDPLDVTANPFTLFSSFSPINFYDAWTLGGFGGYFWNTVVITALTLIGVVALSTLAGYALARFRLPGHNIIFIIFITGLMIPFFSVMIPLFYELRDLGLLGSKAAVILPAIAGAHGFGLPLGVFLMRSFYMDLPEELADAARVDGAGEFSVFWRVMLPLSSPGVAVLAVLVFFQTWNNFILALLYLPGTENQMLATGLYLFASGRTQDTELAAAGSLIMVFPVVVFFLLFQRQFVRGLTAGAFK